MVSGKFTWQHVSISIFAQIDSIKSNVASSRHLTRCYPVRLMMKSQHREREGLVLTLLLLSDDIEIFKNEEFNLYIWSYLQVSELLGDGVGSAELVLQQGERFCTVLDLIGS